MIKKWVSICQTTMTTNNIDGERSPAEDEDIQIIGIRPKRSKTFYQLSEM